MNLKELLADIKLHNKFTPPPLEEANLLDEIAQEVFQREGEKQRIRLEKEAEQEKLISARNK